MTHVIVVLVDMMQSDQLNQEMQLSTAELIKTLLLPDHMHMLNKKEVRDSLVATGLFRCEIVVTLMLCLQRECQRLKLRSDEKMDLDQEDCDHWDSLLGGEHRSSDGEWWGKCGDISGTKRRKLEQANEDILEPFEADSHVQIESNFRWRSNSNKNVMEDDSLDQSCIIYKFTFTHELLDILFKGSMDQDSSNEMDNFFNTPLHQLTKNHPLKQRQQQNTHNSVIEHFVLMCLSTKNKQATICGLKIQRLQTEDILPKTSSNQDHQNIIDSIMKVFTCNKDKDNLIAALLLNIMDNLARKGQKYRPAQNESINRCIVANYSLFMSPPELCKTLLENLYEKYYQENDNDVVSSKNNNSSQRSSSQSLGKLSIDDKESFDYNNNQNSLNLFNKSNINLGLSSFNNIEDHIESNKSVCNPLNLVDSQELINEEYECLQKGNFYKSPDKEDFSNGSSKKSSDNSFDIQEDNRPMNPMSTAPAKFKAENENYSKESNVSNNEEDVKISVLSGVSSNSSVEINLKKLSTNSPIKQKESDNIKQINLSNEDITAKQEGYSPCKDDRLKQSQSKKSKNKISDTIIDNMDVQNNLLNTQEEPAVWVSANSRKMSSPKSEHMVDQDKSPNKLQQEPSDDSFSSDQLNCLDVIQPIVSTNQDAVNGTTEEINHNDNTKLY